LNDLNVLSDFNRLRIAEGLARMRTYPVDLTLQYRARNKRFQRRIAMAEIKKITIVDTEKDAVWGRPTGRNYVRPTQTERAHIALNCYEPGVNDELHCHPGSDHTFFVVQGECTMMGLKDGEEFKLKQHQAVHVPAGFFYQLNNTGTERLILYQVSTEPKPRPKIGKVIYGYHTGLKDHLLNPVDPVEEKRD
jgi:mannose-6-phosphate isomerase-like protein (cupin superfamily)